jgi:hypothetical protein
MADDNIKMLIKIMKGDNTLMTFKLIKPESFSYEELLVEINSHISIKFPNFIIKRSVVFDTDFNSEIDIPENEIFLLENKQVLSFYIEESVAITDSVSNLNKSFLDCSIVSEVDPVVVQKVKTLIDVVQPVCHSPEFSMWRRRVMNKTGTYLVNSR